MLHEIMGVASEIIELDRREESKTKTLSKHTYGLYLKARKITAI